VPLWLKDNALSLKERLGDPKAKISYVLGSFPIAIVHGQLTCRECSGPAVIKKDGSTRTYPVTGSTAAERYDGRTRELTILTITKHGVQETVRSLCENFGPLCASGGPSR
jgi:hypothetical protein